MYIDVNRELDRLLEADQHDPFQVLGCHLIHQDPPTAVIRAFLPHGKTVRLVLGNERREMYRMRDAGLFEIVLANCPPPSDYRFEMITEDRSVRLIDDPYRFPPQLSEFDRYLFNNGTHYELYNKMGAHPTSLGASAGTIFRVWAPMARRVSVLGDFNDWDGRVHQMRCLGTSGIWELFIPGVSTGEPYKFEIKAQNGTLIEKADPFQFHAELRPKSASVVCDLDRYAWKDEEWMAGRSRHPHSSRPLSVYEVHLGSWQRDPATPGRFLSFRELADKLVPYARELGFTHLELLPVMEHIRDDSWGFQVTGYYSPTSRFGEPSDFMHFVDACHQQNIGVILDWIPTHLPADGHGLGRFDGTSLYEEEQGGGHPDHGRLAFRYECREVANFLIANVLFWLDKYHVDGIRADAVTEILYRPFLAGRRPSACAGQREHLPGVELLRHLNRTVTERFPGILMIADEWSRFYGVSKRIEDGGLGFSLQWNREWTGEMLDYLCNDPQRRCFHHGALNRARPDTWAERPILPLSHKEVVHGIGSLLARMPGDKWQQFANLRLLFLCLWAQPGKKLLFMGNEFGQLSEWYSQVSLDWHLIGEGGFHHQTRQFVQDLNRFYLANPALWEMDMEAGGFKWLARDDAENSIIVFARFARDPLDHLVCLLNFTPTVHHDYKMGVPSCIRYREVLSSDAAIYGGSNVCNPHLKEPFAEPVAEAACHVRVSVPPLGGLILKPEPAKTAEGSRRPKKKRGKSES